MNPSNSQHKKIDESSLRTLLKKAAQAPAPNPWFTRTVLRRLPPKRRAFAGRIEMGACIFGLIITVVWGLRFVAETYSAQAITVRDLFTYGMYLTLFGALLANVAWPILSRFRS